MKGQADWSKYKTDRRPRRRPAEQRKAPPPAEARDPKVNLTADDSPECLVKVGDAMPDADLPSLDGKVVRFARLLGTRPP